MPEDFPNGWPGASDRTQGDHVPAYWTCECGHEAMDYDEVGHECPLLIKEA